MKISEAFDAYRKVIVLKGFSSRVIEYHDFVKEKLVEILGDKDLAELTIEDVYEWHEQMKHRFLPDGTEVERSQNTLRSDMNRLKGVLKYMHIIGEKCINYHLIPVPKYECVERCFLYEEEVQAMIDNAVSLRNAFIISLFYSSGIRLSEMLSLNRGDIVNRTFTVIGKGKKERICFIDERTEDLMNQYLESRHDDSPALVVSELYKDRMSKSNVQLMIRNAARRAGINKHVSPHILRHSFATNFVRNNGGIRPLSKLLGHASLNTTMIYTHVADNELKEFYTRFHTV